MGLRSATKNAYGAIRARFAHHVRSPDPLATHANTGATLVWTHLPLYPLLVWWLVGQPVWPTFLLFASWPFFFAVPFVSRRHPVASRALFVLAGIAGTLLGVEAVGLATGIGWFLLPCLVVAATFFRASEWRISVPLTLLIALCAVLLGRLGAPVGSYTAAQNQAFADSLNYWGVGCLAAYLIFVAVRRRIRMRAAA